jgi:membrane protease YdiL (CAAX protease family)
LDVISGNRIEAFKDFPRGASVPDLSQNLPILLLSLLMVALIAGIPIAIFAIQLRRTRTSLFPRIRYWRVSWNGIGVFFSYLSYYYLPQFVLVMLLGSGFFQKIYGPELFPKGKEITDPTPEQQAARMIALHWASVLAFPIILLMIRFLIKESSMEKPTPLGFSVHRWKPNLVLGYLGWLIITPICFATFILVNWLFFKLTGELPDKHPATEIGLIAGTREWILFGVQVLLVAPILEEVLFRGVLLPWSFQRPIKKRRHQNVIVPHEGRPYIVYGFAVLVALLMQSDHLKTAFQNSDWNQLSYRLTPLLFILLLAPILYFVPKSRTIGSWLRIRSPQTGRAIIANACLFAGVHGTWPSPIPIFLLGLMLAYLTVRTRSLWTPILFHSLFNAVSVAMMLLGAEI